MIEKFGLMVHPLLANFIAAEALPDTGISEENFWKEFSSIVHDLAPKNRALLKKRDDLQGQIDGWNMNMCKVLMQQSISSF